MKKIHKIALGIGFLVVAAASVPAFYLWPCMETFRKWRSQIEDTSFHWQKQDGESQVVALVEQSAGVNIASRAQVLDEYADYSGWIDGPSYLGLITFDEAAFKEVYEKCQELTRQSKETYGYIPVEPSSIEYQITKDADLIFFSVDQDQSTILFLKKEKQQIGVLSIGT